ncbi:DMT family transporter [Amycolatopsis pithecellobii]|uniref:EamA family transporter n=1 Tax=Amycolatopsis pithecellobii TaxID=664692 RepID=A0A6N7Z8R9_9PSEU|nr:DMT family transporter [Amycolatopsis pithecellobii]MTD57016.1 EamA family transporter [Amycolatopsis pithecellobii]
MTTQPAEAVPEVHVSRRPSLLALLALVGVTAVWGGTFVVVKDVTRDVSPMDFLAVRFLIATAALAALRPRAVFTLSRKQLGHGVLLGLALGSAYLAQTCGQQYTSASMSGFITGMSVVCTPVLAGLLLRHRIGRGTWGAVAMATVGLGVLSLRGFAIGPGEGLTLLCALFFALHIVGLSEWSTARDAHALTVVQLGVVAVLCLVLGAPDGIDVPGEESFWLPVIGLAVVATAAAYLVQTWAQARLPASAAAVVLTLEPVFAGFFGVLVAHDELSPRILLGAALVVGAMYLAEFRSAATKPEATRQSWESACPDLSVPSEYPRRPTSKPRGR